MLGQSQNASGRMVAPTQPLAKRPASALPAAPQGPQAFELLLGEQTSYGFAASKPGPMVVTVTWQGAPLLVTLVKPGGGTLERQGSGSVTIQYIASAEDCRKGVIWSVNLRSPQPTVVGTGSQVHERPVKLQTPVLAKGTVTLQHPPGDPNLAQAEWTARADKLKASQPKPMAVQATQPPSLLAQKQAILLKQQLTRQTQLLEQVRLKIPTETYQKMAQKITAAASVPLPGARVVGTALPLGPQRIPMNGLPQAGSGLPGPAGAIKDKKPVPAPLPEPLITALSVSAGQPGDPVLISGSGFSGTPGEVHFIVANGRDVTAPISGWNDSQVFAAVPDITGLPAFSGLVYIRRGSTNSRFVPFQFNPALEFRSLDITSDRIIGGPKDTENQWTSVYGTSQAYHHSWYYFGYRDYDQFFLTTRLKNGWVADSAYLTHVRFIVCLPGPGIFYNANAYITEFRGGTDSPYLKVRWWTDGLGEVFYLPVVIIRGPKGVPYQ